MILGIWDALYSFLFFSLEKWGGVSGCSDKSVFFCRAKEKQSSCFYPEIIPVYIPVRERFSVVFLACVRGTIGPLKLQARTCVGNGLICTLRDKRSKILDECKNVAISILKWSRTHPRLHENASLVQSKRF